MKLIINLIIFLFFGIAIYSQEPGWKFTYPKKIQEVYGSLSIYFYSISCYDENNCICVAPQNAVGARIFKTTDGGILWNEIFTDTVNKLIDPWYVPNYRALHGKYFKDGTITVMCEPNIVIKSNDYGISWNRFEMEEKLFKYRTGLFLNKDTIFVIDLDSTGGGINVSYNGGVKWSRFPIPDSLKNGWGFNCLSLYNDSLIALVATGINYTKEYSMIYLANFDGSIFKKVYFPKAIDRFEPISKDIIIAYGYQWDINTNRIDTSFIYKSIDGGKNWGLKFQTDANYRHIDEVKFYNDSLGYALGDQAFFVKTTDQGESWYYINKDLMKKDTTYFMRSLEVPSPNTVYYVTAMYDKIVKYEKISGSVSEPSIKNFNLYPNPLFSTNEVNLEFNAIKLGDCKIYLTDTGSRQLAEFFTGFVEEGMLKMQFQLPKLSSGAYWLVIEMNGYNHIKLLNIVN